MCAATSLCGIDKTKTVEVEEFPSSLAAWYVIDPRVRALKGEVDGIDSTRIGGWQVAGMHEYIYRPASTQRNGDLRVGGCRGLCQLVLDVVSYFRFARICYRVFY